MCAYQGVRNVSFSENFAYVLNEWSLTDVFIILTGKLKKVKETAPRYYLRFCDAGSRNQPKKYGNFYLDRNLVLKIYGYHKCPNLVRILM